jgi:hypothetical protein
VGKKKQRNACGGKVKTWEEFPLAGNRILAKVLINSLDIIASINLLYFYSHLSHQKVSTQSFLSEINISEIRP